MDEVEVVVLEGCIIRLNQDERRAGYVKVGISFKDSGYVTQLVMHENDASMFGYGDEVTVTVGMKDGE